VALAVFAVVVFAGLYVVMVRRAGHPDAPVAPDRHVPA
jgi:hypothetical protein